MTTSRSIALVTCHRWPELFPSDQALADELTSRGHHVLVNPWNSSRGSDFASADVVVLRSNWDYHHDLAAFQSWLQLVENSGVELHNPATLVREYLDKGYMERLSSAGFPTPQTRRFDTPDYDEVHAWATEHGVEQIVIKPAWGASGHGVELAAATELDAALRSWRAAMGERPIVVQQFIAQIADGERSLVYFGGEFSHALVRTPDCADFRANSQYGSSTTLAAEIDSAMIELGHALVASFPVPATYARIDMVGHGDSLVLMEVEVNEPSLGMHLDPDSAARFADAILGI